MSLSERFIRSIQRFLPSPFAIAILLTVFTAFLALLITEPSTESEYPHFFQIVQHWEKGFWELLKFTMQMMLILVLGHALALSKPVDAFIQWCLRFCKSNASSVLILTTFTLIMALINWGLGLVFGAVFARKLGEHALRENIPLNYPLVGASAYAGLMVWHGGLSGSAPLIVSNNGHFLESAMGVLPISETVFSNLNLMVSLLLLLLIPLMMYLVAKRFGTKSYQLPPTDWEDVALEKVEGAERLDYSIFFTFAVSAVFLLLIGFSIYQKGYKAISLDFINFSLFGMALLFHGNIVNFTKAVKKAIAGSSNIMIQFPLYAGIMGIMKYSGLINIFSDFFVNNSTAFTFPIFTFISAGIVNVFVPSGGGQWAVQGPIVIEAATQLGIPYSKIVMALAYGDQLTNMLQPFWALPLLGITGLKAKEILPYTFLLFLAGTLIFGLALLIG